MELKLGKGFDRLGGQLEQFVGSDPALSRALSGCEIQIGLATERGFGVPSHAADSAIFMGDERLLGEKHINAATEAMLRTKPENVQVRSRYNPETQLFDMEKKLGMAERARRTKDGLMAIEQCADQIESAINCRKKK